jgi:hypothetical protein
VLLPCRGIYLITKSRRCRVKHGGAFNFRFCPSCALSAHLLPAAIPVRLANAGLLAGRRSQGWQRRRRNWGYRRRCNRANCRRADRRNANRGVAERLHMPIDALTRAFGAGYGRVKKDEHQREHGGLRQFVGEHGGASFLKFPCASGVRWGTLEPAAQRESPAGKAA